MSHELRTPLNSINGIADLLLYGSYEKDDIILLKLIETIDLINEISHDQMDKKDILSLKKQLKLITKAIEKDSNLKRYYISKLSNKLNKHDLIKSKDNITLNMFKVVELVNAEEKEIFNAYKQIKTSGNYLLGLIDQILNLAKVESGKIQIEKKNVLIADLVENIKNNAESYKKSKGKDAVIKLDFHIDKSVPEFIETDRQKLSQVLLNLISNAIKFTKEGEIKLAVIKINNNVKFSVKDNGKGIKEEDKRKIFVEFERTSDSFGVEGTGLGLVISKQLVELLGGTIEFESEYGKGSEFWFKLPCET